MATKKTPAPARKGRPTVAGLTAALREATSERDAALEDARSARRDAAALVKILESRDRDIALYKAGINDQTELIRIHARRIDELEATTARQAQKLARLRSAIRAAGAALPADED